MTETNSYWKTVSKARKKYMQATNGMPGNPVIAGVNKTVRE
jgi:hypothetical protein